MVCRSRVYCGLFVASPENTVCAKIHGMVFTRPVKKGSIVRCESKVVFAGRASLVAYVKILLHPSDEFVVDGFLTFINVDATGRPQPHGLTIEATTDEDRLLQETAQALSRK